MEQVDFKEKKSKGRKSNSSNIYPRGKTTAARGLNNFH